MQNAKSKAGSTRVDRFAVIAISLAMVGIVLGGLGYAYLEFQAALDNLSNLTAN